MSEAASGVVDESVNSTELSCEEITRAFDRSAGYGSGGAAVTV